MDRFSWKGIVRKTKWASGKKKLGKKALGELMDNALYLEKFMSLNKSAFGDVNRSEVFKKREQYGK